MNKTAIYHLSDLPYAFPIDENTLRVRLQTEKNDIKEAYVHYIDRYVTSDNYTKKKMDLWLETELFDYYIADISQKYNRYRYFFELIDDEDNHLFYNERGFYTIAPNTYDSFGFIYPYIAKTDLYDGVDWLKNGVVYQVFPARFARGNEHPNALPWGSVKENVVIEMDFGGDLRGIINHIPYLSDLGITILYMTPIFKSPSNHKYDTEDYFSVDPSFGTDDDLVELVKKCHDVGIRVVLDAVLNHSGDRFFAFLDVLKNQEKSKYSSWYYLEDFPVTQNPHNYYTFANDCVGMPKLNYSCKELRDYFLNFATYWIKKADIDGWRLDIGNEVPHEFWKDFKKEVRKIKKDFIISGEVFNNASPFLRGDEFDSVMNYMFRYSLTNFLASNNFDAAKAMSFIDNNKTLYTDQINSHLWNLIDSHDTQRFLTDCKGNVNLLKLACVMQFTMIGVPFVYYGTEVGMEGKNDPDNRRCMLWENQNLNLFDFYKKMIKIRKENEALISGSMKVLCALDDILIYERIKDGELIRVYINRGKEEYNALIEDNLTNLFTEEKLNASKVIIGGEDFLILKGVKNG